MSKEYEVALKGTREEAANVAENILKNLKRYEKHKDVQKYQLQYSMQVLHSICVIAQTPQGVHYDIYCDIIERTLKPHVQPKASLSHWAKYLEFLRYFHYLLESKKLVLEAGKIYDCLAGQENKLQNEGDYKHIWSTYCQHLFVQRLRLPAEASEANRQTTRILESMAELFSDMLLNNAKLNLSYPELITEFVQNLLAKRSQSNSYIVSLPERPKTKMFDSFFELMAKMITAQPEPAVLSSHCQRHLEAIVAFVQLDVVDTQQQQVALKYLRTCRELRWLQGEKAMGYVFSLFYYYVKFVYAQTKNENFSKIYVELCGKFTAFFEKSGETLMTEKKWFRDVPVVLYLLFTHIVPKPKTPFEVFFQQMNGVACYSALFELILACIKMAPHVTETKLLNVTCCTSIRKHLILDLALTAIAGYSSFVLSSSDKENEADQALLDSMNKTFSSIIHHATHVVSTMTCINPTSPHLRMLYARFAQLTRDVKTAPQALYSIALAEQFVRIQSKFDEHDWVMLLRRLYKTAALVKEHKMSAVLQSYYIAALMQEKPFNMSVVRNQIGLYYSSSSSIVSMGLDAAHNKCLLEFYECSKSVFKPTLEPQQKRMLHWLETEDAFYYQKTNTALHSSLMRCTQSDYDFVRVVHAAKLPAESMSKLKTLRETLSSKRKKSDCGLKRLEQLTLAHTCSALLNERIGANKKLLTFESKDCNEDTLIELMLRKGVQAMSVSNEMRMIELALEALNAFEEFFNKADSEHISGNEVHIDWEHILDELAAIALYCQYSGYMEYATNTWHLHYRIAKGIDHSHHLIRSLAYFCENADLLENDEQLNLTDEVADQQITILNCLQRFPDLLKRQQSFVLCCLCQMAYFYARSGKLSYAQILLHLVEHKHKELPERQGKYDVVLATRESVKFRILWKFSCDIEGKPTQQNAQIMQKCLMREAESTMHRFHDFASISATDSITYMILIYNLVQQIGECGANRLFDNFLNVFFLSAVKMTLQSGSALRLVQILTMWMWSNLQMENVQKAQSKLKIIECIMGVKSFQNLAQPKADETVSMKNNIKQPVPNYDKVSLHLNPGMEMMRKVAQLHVSPGKMDKMRLSPTARSLDLKRFLSYNSTKTPQPNEILEWTYFAVGCLNARLYFLTNDYEQLDEFYERCTSWLQQKSTSFVSKIFQNIQLINQQYFVNYLRSQKRYDKAILSINIGLDKCIELNRNVDSVYRINLILQLRATKAEILLNQQAVEQRGKQSKLRRALEFNISPEEKGQLVVKSKTRENIVIKEATSKTKKAKLDTKTVSAFTIYNSENDNRTKPLSIRTKTSRLKPVIMVKDTTSDLDDLNMCQAIEISDSDENVLDDEAKESKKKIKSNRKPIEIIDLDDTVGESACHAKVVNKNLQTENGIVEKMKSLELSTTPAIKAKIERTRKPASPLLAVTKSKMPTKSMSKRAAVDLIIAEDPKVLLPTTKSRTNKPTKAVVAPPLRKANSVDVVTNVRGRGRPRKVGIENMENIMPVVASSSTAAASRRRQKM